MHQTFEQSPSVRRSARRRSACERGWVDDSPAKIHASPALKIRERAAGAEPIRFGDERFFGEKARPFIHAPSLSGGPSRVVIPMAAFRLPAIAVPNDRAARMKHIEPMRKCPRTHAHFFAEEVEVRIVRNAPDEISAGKNEVTGNVASGHRVLGGVSNDGMRLQVEHSFVVKMRSVKRSTRGIERLGFEKWRQVAA